MATEITRQSVTLNEVTPTFVAADPTGNTFVSGDRVYVHIKNNQAASAASVTVTISDPNSVEPEGGTTFNADLTLVIPSSTEKVIGPIYTRRFGDTETKLASISYDDASDVEVGVFNLGSPGL